MKLKLDEAGHVVVQDGKPVYISEDGKEVAFDAPATVATITRLNGEAKSHREGKEAAEKALKAFEGITDPSAAIKALDTVSKLDQKKLVDAGEIDTVRNEISKSFEGKLAEIETRAKELEGQLYAEKIGGSFSRSKTIAEKFAIPADLVQARFGSAFKVEDGKVVAYDPHGNKIYSRARPGELADFDEAIETLVDAYPYKDQILKGSGASGSGAGGNSGAGNGGKKSLSRAQFDALDPAGRQAHVKAGGEVTE
ncbi:DUF6651 domain-containing protein [Luteibacter sp. E-22]|uniref:DUF6651 domain-containing protein n=1 Tax=Luteibacter sp. E-22 TaxID=3404050 RepID=UPI003CE88528